MSKQVVTLRVYRFDPGASAPPHYDEFQIPYSKGLTVLDGLIYYLRESRLLPLLSVVLQERSVRHLWDVGQRRGCSGL